MNSRSLSTSTGAASPAVRFHVNLADRTETEAVDRYRRHRRLAADVIDATRRAEAILRLETALRSTTGPYYP